MFSLLKKDKKKSHILDFEKPLVQLAEQIIELEESNENIDCKDAVKSLKKELEALKTKIYSNLTPPQVLQIARHPERPYITDYVKYFGGEFIELHGDRAGADDAAIVGGVWEIEPGHSVVLIGTNKGKGIKEKQECNFGMPQPWGYRKALRLFKHAEKFNMPVVTLVDTPGAYPGLEAEAEGQSEAIARNVMELSALKVPVISIITGEGGSGGALALAVANHVIMLQYSVYSVISPEGCAAILWRSREHAPTAAEKLKITAPELKELELIDQVVEEPLGGAHHSHEEIAATLREAIIENLKKYTKMSVEDLVEQRREKYRNYGFFTE